MIKVFLLFLLYSPLSHSGCEEGSITVQGRTASEAIKKARSSIPNGFVDNSACTSPIISCRHGFFLDKSGEHCKRGNETSKVSATLAIKVP